ncbi:MAG: N-acetyl-gamma-glutamyl-phosphate reductase [Holophagaceae bacterium]|nr:N-acetyl-gamma-glutamyl-phosphate reductase [Holophagaceae bacterium]
MKIRAVILGAAGYGGGELLRLLGGHPNVASILAVSKSHVGQPFWKAHPNLRGFVDGVYEADVDWAALSEDEAIAVFSAQPHFDLAHQLAGLESAWKLAGIADRVRLIDLSGDFRLEDGAAFLAAYGKPHPCADRLGSFVYGLPEWKGGALRGATRIANPGCFATAVQLALLPLDGLDLGFIAVSGVTGSSGSGALPSETAHHPTRAHDFRAYKALEHQHQAEMDGLARSLGIAGLLSFVPHSAPLVRGIFATLQFRLPEGLDETALRRRFQGSYGEAPFIRLVEGSPRIASVVGTNLCEIGLAVKGRSAAILVALDNLMKGMAGQAVQNLNASLGLPEKTGLWMPGLFPG